MAHFAPAGQLLAPGHLCAAWRLFTLLASLALVADGIPQLLPCGSDSGTQMRPGETIMGQPVGAHGPGNLNVSLLRDGELATYYVPGESLSVRLSGMPANGFFAVRVSDGGAQLKPADGSSLLASKCPGQMFAPNRAQAGVPAFAIVTMPCDDPPEVVTISLVGAPMGHGPFYFTTGGVRRGGGRASSCPPKTTAVEPYPFQEPINESCPNGAASQHDAPCPDVPCVHPVGDKWGTCLVTPDQSWPARNGSINAEARVELLTDDVTPISHHYVTGSAPPPRAWNRDMTGWSLRVDGEVEGPRNFTMADLQKFPVVTRRYVLECAGNWGRGMAPAYQQADWWSIGAVACAEWTGVLLRDVLSSLHVKHSAVYVAYYGEDNMLSRGIPIEKAMDGHSMLAWAMNGEPLPAFHGFPLRLLAPGFPGSAQGKWLHRLWIRDREHDGLGMLGKSYRVPIYPLKKGEYTAPDEWFKVFTQQPVRSLIVRPPRCSTVPSRKVQLEGKAWSGAGDVHAVALSWDHGLSWTSATLFPPANKWAWQKWVANITLPSPGHWSIFARATDHTGATQPMLVPGWNPGGYGNNQAMMVDIHVLPSSISEIAVEADLSAANNQQAGSHGLSLPAASVASSAHESTAERGLTQLQVVIPAALLAGTVGGGALTAFAMSMWRSRSRSQVLPPTGYVRMDRASAAEQSWS